MDFVYSQGSIFAYWHHLFSRLVQEAKSRGDLEDSILDLDTRHPTV
jgi:hypothetical protein